MKRYLSFYLDANIFCYLTIIPAALETDYTSVLWYNMVAVIIKACYRLVWYAPRYNEMINSNVNVCGNTN